MMGLMKELGIQYSKVVRFGESLQSLFLLAVRCSWGIGFYLSGSGKLNHLAATTQFFGKIGIFWPEQSAQFVGWVELIGGCFLIAGFLARLASIPLAISMCVAFATAHTSALAKLFSEPSAIVHEAPFNYLLAVLIILAFGPGKFSLDRSLWERK